jgi:polyisoprenoid-binding protein YceI
MTTTATRTRTRTQTQTSLTTWQIDPSHTLVELSARHMMFTTVKGRFTGVKGTIVENLDQPALSSVEAEIDAASISTGDAIGGLPGCRSSSSMASCSRSWYGGRMTVGS